MPGPTPAFLESQLAYGPGKPKPPFPPIAAKASMPSAKAKSVYDDPAVPAMLYHQQMLNQMYGIMPGPGGMGWGHAPEYQKVAKALGFTQAEIASLVACNDAGVPFAAIAALIEQHPVVYSSALTPRRVAEETAFVALCDAKKREHRKAKNHGMSWLWESTPSPYKHGHEPYVFIDDYPAAANPWGAMAQQQSMALSQQASALYDALSLQANAATQHHATTEQMASDLYGVMQASKPSVFWTPKKAGGESLAAMLGIWTPPKPVSPYADGDFFSAYHAPWKIAYESAVLP